MYLRNEENIARELQSLGTLSPDEFLKRAQALEAERAEFLVGPAFGKEIIPLDDLNAEELAQYGIKRTGDIETLSLGRADRDAEAAFRSGGYMGETSPFFINYQSTDPDVLIRYLDADVVGGEPARSMPFVMEDADGAFRAMERKLDEKFRAYNNHDETVPGSGTFQEAEDAFYDTLDEMAELVQERIGTGAAADMRTLSDLELEAYGVTRRYNPEARGIYSAIPREPLPVRKTPDSTLERHRSYMEAIRGIEEGLISEVAQVTDAYKLGHITFTGARQIGDQLYESLHNKYKDIRLNDVYNFDTYNNTIAVLTEILGDNFDATRGAQKQLDKFGKLVERFVQANEERLTGTKVYGFRGPSLSIEINRLRENSEALRAALQDPNLSAAELETHVQRFRDLQEAQHALTLKNTGTGTLGEWAKVRENLLKMMLKENMGNDHRFYKLYNAMMADYYRNLRELLETRIYAPPHFHIISRGLSNPQKNQIVKEALKTYVSFHVIDKKATEQFSPKYSSLFDDFSQRSVAAKEAGASTDIYPELQNVFWNGFLDYLEDNYIQNIIKPSERTSHNVDNMMAQLRANVETMQPEIDNILAEVRAVEEVFTRSMENTNNNFSRKFMEFVEDFDDNVQSTMVGAAVLDNLVPVEELYQNLDQHTVRLVQASALKELFRRGRDWSDVYFRFGVIDENLWKHASHDVEMIGLITDLKDAAKIYLNRYESDHRRKMAYENLEMTLDRLGEEGYFQDGTMFEDFLDFRTDELTPEIIRDVAKIIDKGDTRQVAKELQPPESISHIEFGQGKPKIYRRGVYAVKERSDAEYLHLTTYYEPPRHPVHKYQMLDQIVLFAFRGEDTGGRGVPNPALEYIVVPTELLGEYNPGRFLRRTGNPDDFDPLWIPSTKLGYELDKIDAEKIFGKAGAERIHEVRLLLENLRTFSKNDTAGANAFLHQALTPNTQIFNAIVGTQIGELFYNGDSYLNHLDAVFSLMGMENVLGLLDNAAVMELLLRGTGDRQAQIKTWLVNYRRGAEQLLQTHGVLQDPKENDNMSQPVIPQRAPGRSAMEQLYGN